MAVDGAAMGFFLNWNFGLKFFFGESSHVKIGSRWFLDPKKSKNDSETAKNCQSVDTVTHLEQELLMFLPLFYSFLGFLEFKNLVEPIFDMRGFNRKNFSSKF